jgi:carboxypeptidase T
MLALSQDMWSHGVRWAERGAVADFLVGPEAVEAMTRAGLDFDILIADVDALISAERDRLKAAELAQGGVAGDELPGDFYLDFKDNAAIAARLEALAAARPDLCTLITLGQSLEGRPILGLRVAREQGLPAILYNGCQHAREWISPMTVMSLADQVVGGAEDDPQVSALLDRAEFIFVPVVNPDGYQWSWDEVRLWRKNRRANGDGSFGVDLNRNWGFEWGGAGSSGNPSSETYRGPAPFSEPETQVLRDFFIANPSIVGTIDFHSYGQLLIYPWAYSTEPCADAPEYSFIGNGMASRIAGVSGQEYLAGQVATLLYLASGGSVDWTYGERGALSYTIELRDTGASGFILPPEQIIPTVEECLPAALHFADMATSPALLAPASDQPPTLPSGESALVGVSAFDRLESVVSVSMHARIGLSGSFTPTVLGNGEGNFDTLLPAAPCGALVQWYFEATTNGGSVILLPPGGPSAPFEATAVESRQVWADDFESDQGWSVGAPGDDATSGIWLRVDPVGTIAQPEDDHTVDGVQCWVTGQGVPGGAAGAADVDGGSTSLTSPPLDALEEGLSLSAWIWYSNNLGAAPSSDSMLVELSADGGSTWLPLAELAQSTNVWVRFEWELSPVVAPTSALRVRFVARDLGAPSLVEAAIDDVELVARRCLDGVLGDLDRDGDIDGADLGILLGAWGETGEGLPADLDGDGDVDGADLGILLGGWSAT